MSIFDEYSQLQELTKLKEIVPEFAQADNEPFIRSVQQDVTPPTWNKIKLSDNVQGTGGTGSNSPTFQAIVVQNGIGKYATVLGTVGGNV